ncbi:GD24008 [Drosophila simulans]|uniref:GD24008 n=1 Tax=Drosophila simulans TaxID=7240 RepID=B4Q6F1_DROSI|nr:GD24008 [Drosophila simulans]
MPTPKLQRVAGTKARMPAKRSSYVMRLINGSDIGALALNYMGDFIGTTPTGDREPGGNSSSNRVAILSGVTSDAISDRFDVSFGLVAKSALHSHNLDAELLK